MTEASEPIVITNDLEDVDGKVILSAGTEINNGSLKPISAGHPHKKLKFIEGSFLQEDARVIVRERNYREIFSDEEQKEKIVEAFGRIALTAPLRHEMELMKKRSIHLYHHSIATTIITLQLVRGKLVEDKDLDKIGLAMLLHDIGMTRINQKLMQNTDYLSPEEFREIKSHVGAGAALITYYLGDGIGVTVSFRHHELKGAGYPQLEAKASKIVNLATMVDVFNALISHRPFRLFSYDIRGAIESLSEMARQDKIEEAFVKLLAAGYSHSDEELKDLKLKEKKIGFVPADNYYGISYTDQD